MYVPTRTIILFLRSDESIPNLDAINSSLLTNFWLILSKI